MYYHQVKDMDKKILAHSKYIQIRQVNQYFSHRHFCDIVQRFKILLLSLFLTVIIFQSQKLRFFKVILCCILCDVSSMYRNYLLDSFLPVCLVLAPQLQRHGLNVDGKTLMMFKKMVVQVMIGELLGVSVNKKCHGNTLFSSLINLLVFTGQAWCLSVANRLGTTIISEVFMLSYS